MYLFTCGTVLVTDETGQVAAVLLRSSPGSQPLHRLPVGIFVGIPERDGTVEVHCRDGSLRQVGYVSPGLYTRVRVSGQHCEDLREII